MTYTAIKDLRRKHRSATGGHGQNKRQCQELQPVWFDRLLRQDRLFDDLQAFRLLVSFQLFAKARCFQFFIGFVQAVAISNCRRSSSTKSAIFLRRRCRRRLGNQLLHRSDLFL